MTENGNAADSRSAAVHGFVQVSGEQPSYSETQLPHQARRSFERLPQYLRRDLASEGLNWRTMSDSARAAFRVNSQNSARRAASRVWNRCVDVEGSAAERILKGYGAGAITNARYHPSLRSPAFGCPLPAIVGAISPIEDPDCVEAIASIFWLDPYGAGALRPRKQLAPFGAVERGVFVTRALAGSACVVALGMSEAVGADALQGLPAIGLVLPQRADDLELPSGIDRVVLALRLSSRPAALKSNAALLSLGRRLADAGRCVEHREIEGSWARAALAAQRSRSNRGGEGGV